MDIEAQKKKKTFRDSVHWWLQEDDAAIPPREPSPRHGLLAGAMKCEQVYDRIIGSWDLSLTYSLMVA